MKTRICTKCRIGWDKYKLGLDCPNCNDQGMFTIDVGAIGTEMVLKQLHLTHDDFAEHKEPELV